MGNIFDIRSARLYEKWYNSGRGAVMENFVEKLLPEMLAPCANERLLVIGVGSGNHLLLLHRLGFNVSGIEASPCMLDMAKARLGNRCELKKGRAEDIPYDDNEFEYAIFVNTLEFVDDPLEALREAGRVTRKKVLIVVINPLSFYRVCEAVKGKISGEFLPHVRPCSIWRLKNLVKRAYGPVSVSWHSANMPKFIKGEHPDLNSYSSVMKQSPFGYFLGLSARIDYSVRTDNLPVKAKIKRAEHSVVRGVSPVSNMNNEIRGEK